MMHTWFEVKEVNMDEIWMSIIGYESMYQVSNIGRVISVKTTYKKKIPYLSHHIDKYGYPYVILTSHSKSRRIKIHRLIAQSFIPNPENKPEVDHIDGNRMNFNIDNLRWCTRKENMNNVITKKRISISKMGKKPSMYAILKSKEYSSKPLVVLSKEGNEIEKFKSVVEASEIYGICQNWIRRVCRGELKSAKGLIFKYL